MMVARGEKRECGGKGGGGKGGDDGGVEGE